MRNLKKLLAIGLCSTMVVSAFAGCSNSTDTSTDSSTDTSTDSSADTSSDSSSSDEPIQLIWFTEAMDDSELERNTTYIVDPFNEANPEYEVVISATADYETVLKVQMAADNGPDICNMGGPSIVSEYVSSGKILDLTSYVEESGLDEIIYEWALNSCKIDDAVYSIPNSYEALLLWYNVDLFEEYGWEEPTTYDELEALCNAIQDEGLIPIAFGTSDFKAINEQFLSVAFACYAGRDNVVKALTGELEWTDEIFVESIECLNDMWQAGWINDCKSYAISDDDSNALFYSGEAVMRMTGTWQLGTYAEQITDFEYSACTFPSLNDDVPATLPLGVGGVTAVNASTEYPDACFAFIASQFMDVELHAQAVAEGQQPLPMDIPEDAYPDTISDVDIEILTTLSETQQDLESSGHVMWTYWPAETRQYMMDNIENIYMGVLTVVDYLTEAQELFAAELEEGVVPSVS